MLNATTATRLAISRVIVAQSKDQTLNNSTSGALPAPDPEEVAETETRAVAIETAEEDTVLAILALTQDAAVAIVTADATPPDPALTPATTREDTLAQPLATTSAEAADLLPMRDAATLLKSRAVVLAKTRNEPRKHIIIKRGNDAAALLCEAHLKEGGMSIPLDFTKSKLCWSSYF